MRNAVIPFNRPPHTGAEDQYVLSAIRSPKLSGDGHYTLRCHQWFREQLGSPAALLTPSCTQALEMAALLIDLQPGDEVIMPSFTFVSTANAFVLRGARVVFVDIRPDTMNIDETLIEDAITPRTKAIVVVHYAGIACEMDTILDVGRRRRLSVIEDAAQGMMAHYKGRPLGTLGDLGTFSFHETKNYTSGGEGGLLIINDDRHLQRAEIIREKGTNRSQFFRGMVDKYSWVDLGSSYLPSEIQAAYLWGQLTVAGEINQNRLRSWNAYHQAFADLEAKSRLVRPTVPPTCTHNAHMYYIKAHDLDERSALLDHLKHAGVMAVFHYVPLHSAAAGLRFSRFHGTDRHTTRESERLLRLPLWYGLEDAARDQVIQAVLSFYR